MQRWISRIDSLSGAVGWLLAWLTVLMILVGAFNAVGRYAGRFVGMNLSSNAYLEFQWYLFSAIFLLGASYALSSGAHVRVDVLYARFSARTRAWVDLLGGLVFLIPFTAFSMWLTWGPVARSWQIRESSPDPGGLARYPIKALILVGFLLLLLQGLAEIAKAWIVLRSPRGADPADPSIEETSLLGENEVPHAG